MDIEYTFPGPIKVTLDARDSADLAFHRHVSVREGFIGIESKTWVRIEEDAEKPHATIDGDGDLNIYVPWNATPPTVIEAKDVQPGNRATDDIAFHFLGATGTITLDVDTKG